MRTFGALLAAVLTAFSGAASSTSSTVPCVTIERTLSVGSTGAEVAKLQTFLWVSPTAYFGPQTKQKLIEWQLSKKIVSSSKTVGAGTTGPKTRAALRCQNTATSSPALAPLSPQAKMYLAPATSSDTNNVAPSVPSGGGGGGAVSVPAPGNSCPIDPPKPTGACAGVWRNTEDEAGCLDEWTCDDPNDPYI